MKLPIQNRLYLYLSATVVLFSMQACDSLQLGNNIDQEVIGYSFFEEIDAPERQFEPAIGAAVPETSEPPLVSADLPYPPFNAFDVKAIGPDGWGNRDQLVDAGVGGVIFNLVWSHWQSKPNLSLNDPNTFEYDGMVWRIDPIREKQIRWYTDRGIKVSAVLYGTPEWARPNNTAKVANVELISPVFIAPDNPADFARFTGMIAKRFNGANGNGRIVNFIVQNEVNSLDWFNPGCGANGYPCSVPDRINSYAALYNQSYDRIIAEQSQARVMYSFDHHFGREYADAPRFSSAQRFIEELAPMVGNRQWRLAFHSYPSDLFYPEFGPYDFPKVTFGNIGLLAGYLRQNFRDKPHAWDIHLTENGINANTPSSTEFMTQQLSLAFKNVLGTPGIETFVYHRLRDHLNEADFQPGLHYNNDAPKPAWNKWASNTGGKDYSQPMADGFENLPYVQLIRYYNPAVGHWTSTRQPPAGYVPEVSFMLLREPIANSTLLYECHDGNVSGTFISADLNCNGHWNFGPVGYVYDFNNASNTRRPLFSIKVGEADYILADNSAEGGGVATFLGFVDPVQTIAQATPERNLAYFKADNGQTTQAQGDNDVATVFDNWIDCSVAGLAGCMYQWFNVLPGQAHTLSCSSASPQPQEAITLSFGSNHFSSTKNVVHSVTGSGPAYTVALPIAQNSNWTSVVLSSETGPVLSDCAVVKSGVLRLGAANTSEVSGLLQNGGFENPIYDWEFCEHGHAFSTNAYRGKRAMQVGNGNCVYQEIAVKPGNTYRLNCQALNNGSGDTLLNLSFASRNFQQLSEQTMTVIDPDYQQYTTTLTAPPESAYAVVNFGSQGGGLLDSCSVELVR